MKTQYRDYKEFHAPHAHVLRDYLKDRGVRARTYRSTHTNDMLQIHNKHWGAGVELLNKLWKK